LDDVRFQGPVKIILRNTKVASFKRVEFWVEGLTDQSGGFLVGCQTQTDQGLKQLLLINLAITVDIPTQEKFLTEPNVALVNYLVGVSDISMTLSPFFCSCLKQVFSSLHRRLTKCRLPISD